MSKDMLLLGAGAGAFNPSAIAGLTLWLKANALSLNDGDPVATWPDSGGEGNDVEQTTEAARPTFKTNIINGLPVVRFDGIDDFMLGPAISTLLTASAWTLFVVFQASGINTNNAQTYNNDGVIGDADGWWSVTLKSTPTAHVYTDGGGDKNVSQSISLDTPTIIMGRLDGGSLYASKNGGSESSVVCGDVSSLTGLFRVGRAYSVFYLEGDIAEVLLYNAALSAGDISSVISALKSKYGIS